MTTSEPLWTSPLVVAETVERPLARLQRAPEGRGGASLAVTVHFGKQGQLKGDVSGGAKLRATWVSYAVWN